MGDYSIKNLQYIAEMVDIPNINLILKVNEEDFKKCCCDFELKRYINSPVIAYKLYKKLSGHWYFSVRVSNTNFFIYNERRIKVRRQC